MTHRIERATYAGGLTLVLGGEMDSDLVAELGALMAAEEIALFHSISRM